MECLKGEHQNILERELWRAEKLRQEKKKSEERALWLESQLQAALQAAAATGIQAEPTVSVQHPSGGYSLAVEEQRLVNTVPHHYYPVRVDHCQEIPQTESVHEVSSEGLCKLYTSECALDPTAQCFEPQIVNFERNPLHLRLVYG